ncbi:MAG TPA: TolC family protein, partial [Verrucomicrobiae bacterium]
MQAAFALKKSYYQLYFLDEKIRVNKQTLDLLADLEKLARSQNEVGKVTLQDVLRAQVEQDRLRTETINLDDSRHSLMAQFKAALGLTSDQPDPPAPAKFESTPVVSDEQLWTTALARNPELKAMAAEVRRAEASLRLAHKERVPDFNLGLEADALAAPTMFRPQ